MVLAVGNYNFEKGIQIFPQLWSCNAVFSFFRSGAIGKQSMLADTCRGCKHDEREAENCLKDVLGVWK
jgi:hypothetical protein